MVRVDQKTLSLKLKLSVAEVGVRDKEVAEVSVENKEVRIRRMIGLMKFNIISHC